MKFIEGIILVYTLGAISLSWAWCCLDFHFCNQSFCKQKKLKILVECSFHWSETGRDMKMDCPLDTWWTWHLSWKPSLPRGRDFHQPSQNNSVFSQLHSGWWLFLLYYESPLNYVRFHVLFPKSLMLMGFCLANGLGEKMSDWGFLFVWYHLLVIYIRILLLLFKLSDPRILSKMKKMMKKLCSKMLRDGPSIEEMIQ